MRNFFAIWRRELTASFLSPVAYVTMVVFLAVTGATFLTSVIHNVGSDELLSHQLFASLIVWLTVLVTVVCMRLFAEEIRSGTIEALLTTPVTDAEVVLGKYAGALTFIVIATVPAVANIFVLAALSPGVEAVDAGAVAGGCLSLLLMSAFCTAVGALISLLTRNQIVAAICTFTVVWGVLLLGWLLAALPFGWARAGEYLSAMMHVEDFARGAVDTRPIVLYVSMTAFVLFAAVRVLESRRWR